jgi:hypothetical protein
MPTTHGPTVRSKWTCDRSTDLIHAIHSSSSVLLIDSGHSDEGTFAALLDAGRPPFWWCNGTEFTLPPEPIRTLILENPAGLVSRDQGVLFDWISLHPATQIITMAPQPLYPLVQAGTFAEDLYYRLNAFMIQKEAYALRPTSI